jgi:hypothetical protein
LEVIEWLKDHKSISPTLSILGGEATLHKGFKAIIQELAYNFRITVTTNLFSALFKDMGEFVAWAEDYPVRWNTSYAPGQGLEVEEYIKRVRQMRGAGLWVDQVSSVDVPELTDEIINKLMKANIVWSLQYATLICDGTLKPMSERDIRTEYPLRWKDYHKYIGSNYGKYQEMCSQTSTRTVQCTTDRVIIAPDNHLYRCHAHAYRLDKYYSAGHISESNGTVPNLVTCVLFGHCEPCDVGKVMVRSNENSEWKDY